MFKNSGLVSVLVLFGGCLGGDPATPEPLSIEHHDDQTIRGTFAANSGLISFAANMPRGLAGTVEVAIDDAVLAFEADAASGEIRFDPHGATLTLAHRDALSEFSRAIGAHLGDDADVTAMHTGLLVGAARYFADAPVDTLLHVSVQRTEPLDRTILGSTSDDGKKCITRGTKVAATFSGSAGTTTQYWIVGSDGGTQWNGDYECMGRCGTGCGSYDWTLDCLEHDACSRKYFSTDGVWDSNCGDEYEEAADDYASFWKRCR